MADKRRASLKDGKWGLVARRLAAERGDVRMVLLALRSGVEREVVVDERALGLAVGVLEDDDGVGADIAVYIASVLVQAFVRCGGVKD